MKILIIGGVAAGTKTAAKLKREDRSAEVTILTKGKDISYAGCGLPYYVGGVIREESDLIVNTPQKYEALTGVKVLTGREAIALDSAAKKVTAKNLENGETEIYDYDTCVICTGASSVVPDMPGISLSGVFKMRTPEDAVSLRAFIQTKGVKKAVVAGGSFIGLEIAENLKRQGVQVTVIDFAQQIMPNIFDTEMADFAKKKIQESGIRILTGTKLEEVLGSDAVSSVKTSQGVLPAELLVLSIGVRPNTAFLADSGIEMVKGTIVVDSSLKTNLPDVYAAGDCVMVTNRITGKPQWSAMGSSANYEGRTLAQVLTGQKREYPGVLGTAVVKLPGFNAAKTGLTEVQAKEAGFDVETVLAITDDKAHYYPDSDSFVTKLIADKKTMKLLGAQVFGSGNVDKMIDIAVTGISMHASLADFENMDLAYAPPFSTAIHPFVQAVYILRNKIEGVMTSMTPAEYKAGAAAGYTVVDVCPQPKVQGAVYVELTEVNGPIEGLAKDEKLLLVCLKGKRSYFLQNRLKAYGYTNTSVLEGATFFNDVRIDGVKYTVTPEQIKAVKALGFLHDKNTPDKFNGRVITRNGKITAREQSAIAEAAEKFGSGEVTMTTRLTLEIQGVPYDSIEPMREFLGQYGLETGGTGSKVRPVVSCKGTTCQYGLIDTFALSEEIHERFYHGYAQVKLPHKFKIAVGGCPNNCVKPNLNDIGIVGQRMPELDGEACKGCKKCQIAESCAMKAASVVDGKLVIDRDKCNNCGLCVGRCPFKAMTKYTNGYRIYIGGRWGKKAVHGQFLERFFTSKEEVLDTVEKAILFFRDQGNTGERFSDTVERLGFEYVQEQILSDELLAHKEENLKAEKHLVGGATC